MTRLGCLLLLGQGLQPGVSWMQKLIEEKEDLNLFSNVEYLVKYPMVSLHETKTGEKELKPRTGWSWVSLHFYITKKTDNILMWNSMFIQSIRQNCSTLSFCLRVMNSGYILYVSCASVCLLHEWWWVTSSITLPFNTYSLSQWKLRYLSNKNEKGVQSKLK